MLMIVIKPAFCRKEVNMTRSSLITIFRASNFLELMWPSFALSQGFGLFPYKISRGVMCSSIPGYVYSTSILTILSFSVITCAILTNFAGEINFDSVPALVQANCYLLLGYSCCLTSFFLSNRKLDLFKKICGISHYVKKCRWNKSARFLHGKDVFGFLFLIFQMPNAFKGNHLDVFFKITCFYVTLVIYLLDNQFVNCVLATKICFETVNRELKIIESKLMSREFYFARRFCRDNRSLGSLIEIRSIRKKYEDLCAVVKCTKDAFSLSVIISVALTFAEVTFSIYFYILKSIGAKEINLEKQTWYFYFITSATYYSSKFLVVVWTCETTKDEAQKTKVIVHRILTQLYDREIIEELQSFSLQMIQRDISFSVHGISLDGSLIRGIAGGISTYILILIQFMIADQQYRNK